MMQKKECISEPGMMGERFIDVMGGCQEEIYIDNEGYGVFKVKAKSISVWINA